MREHHLGQPDFASPAALRLAAEQHVGAVFHQGYKTNLRICAGAAAGPEARESILDDLLIGHIKGAVIQAHQSPGLIPRATRNPYRDGLDQFIMRLLKGLPARRVQA